MKAARDDTVALNVATCVLYNVGTRVAAHAFRPACRLGCDMRPTGVLITPSDRHQIASRRVAIAVVQQVSKLVLPRQGRRCERECAGLSPLVHPTQPLTGGAMFVSPFLKSAIQSLPALMDAVQLTLSSPPGAT